MIFTLLLSTLPLANADQGPSKELRKLRNVINNSIPEKYRDQLNDQLERLEASIDDSCHETPKRPRRDNGAPLCTVEFSNTYSKLVREGQVISDWSSSISVALDKLRAMQEADLCSLRMEARPCKIEFSNSYSKLVVGNGNTYRDWSSDMNVAVNALKELRQIGICE